MPDFQEQTTEHAVSLPVDARISLEIDDAFSDGEELVAGFHFTSDDLRRDLAANIPTNPEWTAAQDEAEDLGAMIGVSKDPEDMVDDHMLVASLVQTSSPGTSPTINQEGELGARFSSINLNDYATEETEVEEIIPPEVSQNEHRSTSSEDLPPMSEVSVSPHSASSSEDVQYAPNKSAPDLTQTTENHPVTPMSPKTPTTTATSIITADPPTAGLPSTPTSSTSSPPEVGRQTTSRHRTTRSIGPSIFQKVVSKTRPTHLPPKPKTEDNKHLAVWEDMMKKSRAAEEKRRKEAESRKFERERHVEESLHVWQKEIVPDWKTVRKIPALRRMWWAGIPTSLRASMWEHAVGNPLALNKDNYKKCLARANRALAASKFNQVTLDAIEQDILSTLPRLHIFHPETGPLYQDLKEMLCAWVVARSDEGLGYHAGIARIAGMLLLNMSANQAFIVMRNLLERHCLRSFYGGPSAKDEVEAYYRIFDTLLADGMPKIYFNFKQHQISPSAYLPGWLLPLFLDHLPFDACARIWDVIVLEGDAFLFRAALAVLGVLEPRLFFPDRQELLELLRGENKAAIEVASRNGRPLDGGKYEIYGLDEETLWERIDAMDEWWKESTWTRLITRELPDM